MKKYPFIVTKGHQVASGNAGDLRFPIGTIAAQKPYFKKLGLDLADYFCATLNAQFACDKVVLTQANYSFSQVKWHRELAAEDFKFYDCQVIRQHQVYSGLIYQPQIETKKEHFQPENLIEILLPYIKNIHYGDELHIISRHLTLQ